MNVKIKKGNQTKTITKYSWDLMGENKNGWSLVGDKDQPVENLAPTAPLPPSGNVDNSKVENLAEKPVVTESTEQPVENLTSAPDATEETESNESNTNEPVSNEVPAFMDLVKEHLKKPVIKDFLDMKNVKYKNNASEETLHRLLGDALNWDINALKNEFAL